MSPSTLVPAEAAYDAFAPWYDAFTADHDYARWVPALEALARRHGLAGRRLLDVGCGTGKSLEAFLDLGYEATGSDVSGGMLAEAEARVGDRARLVRADVRELPRLGEFDLVTCLDDVLNYMADEAELVAALRSLRPNLGDRGLLMFDLNELATYRGFFSETVCVEGDGRLIVWRGHEDGRTPPGATVTAELDAFLPGEEEGYVRRRSLHRQRHFPEPAVRAALERAGLECVAVHGQDVEANFHAGVDPAVATKAVYLALPGGGA